MSIKPPITPEHETRLLDALRAARAKDLRIGQLFVNAFGAQCQDPFYADDERFVKTLEYFIFGDTTKKG